jgi:hypothetical protein
MKTLLATALAGGLLACGGGGDPSPAMQGQGQGQGSLGTRTPSWAVSTEPADPATLSAAETDGLLAMREEEQLAHDVYAVSASLWATPVFANIQASEATHSAAMQSLLDRYALSDPLEGLSAGVFKTPAFQALYDSLAARSRLSLIDALQVGCEIEELDMRDIVALMATADNADILTVYGELLRGSRNHLRSYWKVLLQQGGSYTPQYLTQAEFDAIANSDMETGR